MHHFKTVGVLGGMGPAASSDLYRRIIDIAQKRYNAQQDTDYPPMIIYNLPLTGFDETGFVDAERVKEQLVAGVKRLENAGADFIVIACNTVHHFHDEMQQSVAIPIVNLPQRTAERVRQNGHAKIGLLSSRSTRDLGLYARAFETMGIDTVDATEEEQGRIDESILRAMSGTHCEDDIALLKNIISTMITKGAEAVILGCTELPLIIGQRNVHVPLYDTITIGAEEALARARTMSEDDANAYDN